MQFVRPTDAPLPRLVRLQRDVPSVAIAMAAVVATIAFGWLGPTVDAGAAPTSLSRCLRAAEKLKGPTARAAARQKCDASAKAAKKPASTVPASATTVVPPGTVPTAAPGAVPVLGGCVLFPADNPWNQRVDSAVRHASSDLWVNSLGPFRTLHPDFGGSYGIPFTVVPATQAGVPITFTAYGSESDPGPYPIPLTAPVEGGPGADGDRHVLVVQSGVCKMFELYRAFPAGGGWQADSGAVFDLKSNALRPEGWTSADAAGLPITAGLVRYEDIADGELRHAVRFTAQCTQRAYVHPATHQAGKGNPSCPPMGARFRMKASFDTSAYTGQTRIILEGLKRFGMIVADNGSNWFITGSVDPRWNVEDLEQMKRVPGGAFEAVETGPLRR